jgi:FkbM family methyltransferase
MRFVKDATFELAFETKDFDGARYFVPEYARHRPACRCILRSEHYEPKTHEFISELMKAAPGNIVHAGAFFGDMIPSFSRSCHDEGMIYAFEPLLENYILARMTIDFNNLSNVVLFNSGLGDAIGPCKILREAASGYHMGGGSRVSDVGDVTSSIVTVDSLGLAQVSVFVLDVEGFELKALRGARGTLASHSSVVMIEDNEKNCDPFLNDIGYNKLGKIPGLSIWCPATGHIAGEMITRFLSSN